MTRPIRPLLVVILLVAFAGPVGAQAPAPAPAPSAPVPAQPPAAASARDASAAVPVQLQIVIVRYQGTTAVSRLPYVLSVNAGEPGYSARLRMNGSVPVSTVSLAKGDDGAISTVSSFNYRDIGTNIDVSTIASLKGRFGFDITVTDTSLYGDGEVKVDRVASGPAMYRSFNVRSPVYMRDGETTEFTAATDRLTGEVTKVEVTLTVLK